MATNRPNRFGTFQQLIDNAGAMPDAEDVISAVANAPITQNIDADVTIARQSGFARLTKTGAGNVTVTLDDSTFQAGDIVYINKNQTAGILTVNTTNNQTLPDGTTATSNFFPDGSAGTVELKYDGSVWTLRII